MEDESGKPVAEGAQLILMRGDSPERLEVGVRATLLSGVLVFGDAWLAWAWSNSDDLIEIAISMFDDGTMMSGASLDQDIGRRYRDAGCTATACELVRL